MILSDDESPLVRFDGVSHVTMRGIAFECGLGNGVEVNGGEDVLLAGCSFRNLGRNGVVIHGGFRHGVRSSDFSALGYGGIVISGGDRATLTPCRHFAENNHLHHLSVRKKVYAPAIMAGGFEAGDAVGVRVVNNLIHDLPHGGVLYGGNDNVFERNEIYAVVLVSGDMGAFYTTNDFTSQGNVLRHNFVHDCPRGNAFYMDDGDSGDTIEENLVVNCFYGPFIGGGHDNVVRCNLIVGCECGIHLDPRGLPRGYGSNPRMLARLQNCRPAQPPWSEQYPGLAKLLEGPRDLPVDDVIERNVTIRCRQPLHLAGKPEQFRDCRIEAPVDLGAMDPRFVDATHSDYRLRKDSPVFQRLPDFPIIPFEKIGLYRDEFRTTLPERAASAVPQEAAFDSQTDVEQTNRETPRTK